MAVDYAPKIQPRMTARHALTDFRQQRAGARGARHFRQEQAQF